MEAENPYKDIQSFDLSRHAARERQKMIEEQCIKMTNSYPSFLDPKDGWNKNQVARAEILRDSSVAVDRRLSMVAEELQRGGLVSPPMAVYTVVVDARTALLKAKEDREFDRRIMIIGWSLAAVMALIAIAT